MSGAIINPSNNNEDGPSRKRTRGSSKQAPSNQHNTTTNCCYKNISFHERTSTGQPGSPHRYFEHSYDVSFQEDCVDDDTSSSLLSSSGAATNSSDDTAADDNKQSNIASKNRPTGNQVVHRHVNGLCIITAGNTLQTTLQRQISSSSSDDKSQQKKNHQSIITSIKYLVKVSPDAQSAKGKLRAKNKKRKKNNNNNKNKNDSSQANCGDVSPTDALCEVTFANGKKLALKCCVQGTIIELNHRLLAAAADSSAVEQQQQKQSCNGENNANGDGDNNPGSSGSNSSSSVDVKKNASLLLTDPLLDGYLAVIMPNRGTHLPTL